MVPEIIGRIQNSWVSGGYLPALTFLQVLIASVLIYKNTESPQRARIFRFMCITGLLLLSDAKLVCSRLKASRVIEDLEQDLSILHHRQYPHFWVQTNFDHAEEHLDECYSFMEDMLEDDDEDQEDEG